MKSSKKFNGKNYIELRPRYGSGLIESKTLLAKSLPELKKPLLISDQSISEPATAKQINLHSVRKLKNAPSGKGFCAIVIDTGVFEHKLLQGKIISRYSVDGDNADVEDLHGHGTHMAGIIVAKTVKYTCMGIAPDAKIISIKVTKGSSGSTSWANIYKALTLANEIIQNPEKMPQGYQVGVINLSFNGIDAGENKDYHCNHMISKIIDKLTNSGVPVVVSSGNGFEYHQKPGLGYPAYLNNVIPVGATFNFAYSGLPDESLATYSQRYEAMSTTLGIDIGNNFNREEIIYAPGAFSLSLSNGPELSGYTVASGTSVAAAVVSGCILLLQEQGMNLKGRPLTVAEVKDALYKGSERFRNIANQTATPGNPPVTNIYFDRKYYDGLNIFEAINYLN